MIQPGIYFDLSSEDYHGDKNSISRSALMDFKRNPRRYWAKHLNPNRPPAESKPSWEFGTAFHTLILEPHLFHHNYFIMPPKFLKKEDEELFNVHKAAEKEAETTSRIVLSHAHCEQLLAMQSSLEANERASELIRGAIYESSYFWKDRHSQIMIKSRPDILNGNIYVDLKTCEDASAHKYQSEMVKGGYHIQAAMLHDGLLELKGERLAACINICVEKTYPYSIGIYIIENEAIEAGRHVFKQSLLDLKSCLSDNAFPDYEIQEIGLPAWIK